MLERQQIKDKYLELVSDTRNTELSYAFRTILQILSKTEGQDVGKAVEVFNYRLVDNVPQIDVDFQTLDTELAVDLIVTFYLVIDDYSHREDLSETQAYHLDLSSLVFVLLENLLITGT